MSFLHSIGCDPKEEKRLCVRWRDETTRRLFVPLERAPCTNTPATIPATKTIPHPMCMGSAVTAGILPCWRLAIFACPKVRLEEIVIRGQCRRRDWIFRTLDSCPPGSRLRLDCRPGLPSLDPLAVRSVACYFASSAGHGRSSVRDAVVGEFDSDRCG